MMFLQTADQALLDKSIAQFLDSRYPSERVRELAKRALDFRFLGMEAGRRAGMDLASRA